MTWRVGWVALLLVAGAGCSVDRSGFGLAAPSDGGRDAALDARPDGGRDGGPDARTDAGMDAGRDAGVDAGQDAGPDVDAGPACDGGVSAEVCNGVDDDCNDMIDEGACLPGMIGVPAGPFVMGCDPAADPFCGPEELPSHVVTLSAYQIDKTEVTQSAYETCVEAGACAVPPGGWAPAALAQVPVLYVTWDEANAYCAFVGARLPTEAEWERAARGVSGQIYPWGNSDPDCTRADYYECLAFMFMPTTVDSTPAGASPIGALDMAGNVSEWVADWFDPAYYASSPAVDPPGPAAGTGRVFRGGGWMDTYTLLRASQRAGVDPADRSFERGFRCAAPP